MVSWAPTATIDTLRIRAKTVAEIRQFFDRRHLLEVDVPVLSDTGVTDVHIDCLQTRVNGIPQYLQSSPEYFMKRLLAAGSGPIYYLGKAFREGESGRRHRSEFTMLEWYRTDWDEHQLMDEVAELIQQLGVNCAIQKMAYADVFENITGLNPHGESLEKLQALASRVAGSDFSTEGRSTCLDLIFSLLVEPKLPEGLVFIFNYPACQSALAQLDHDVSGEQIARRFEVFLNRVELANGYYELRDPVEQRSRFAADVALRQAMGKPAVPLDEKLLAAMDEGLPKCSGVALGVDRLLMQLQGIDDISGVVAFAQTGDARE